MRNKKALKGKVISLLLVTFLMGLLLVGCGSKNQGDQTAPSTSPEVSAEATSQPEQTADEAFNVTITDSTGTEITLTKKPERIVSLAPSTTEILCALGLEDKMVGRTKYCNYPESITALPEVGGTSNPNVEAIVDLNPDLVVGATHVSEEVIGKLREVGINVAFLNEQENFEGTYSAIEKVGMLTGTDEKAAEVVAEMKQKVADLETALQGLNLTELPKVYYATGFGEGDYGAGGDTFIGEIIHLAGATNIAQEISGWSISKEQIADGDPDIIIVPSGVNMAADMATTDFYKDLRAVKEGKVYEIDGDSISRQGPRVADALVEMAQKIHPELAK